VSSFHAAKKTATPARIAIAGPAGSGKTYTALALAAGFGGSVGVIDTNRRTASLYAGLNGWEFDVVTPTTFSPERLTDLVLEAGDAGYDTLILDSWTAYWNGPEGMLEQVDARSKGATQHQGWKEARPMERAMMDALLAYPGNVIVTLRVKTEVTVDRDAGDNKGRPFRVGLKPEQKDGIEYEFHLYGDLDPDHGMTVSKSHIPALASTYHPKPGKVLAGKITKFLSDGLVVPSATELRDKAFAATTKDEINVLGRQAEYLGLLLAPVNGADGQLNVLDNVLRGRMHTLPTADELAAQQREVSGPAVDAGADPNPEQPPAGEAWPDQSDTPTPEYVTGKSEESTNG
jgi:hypothetical protein